MPRRARAATSTWSLNWCVGELVRPVAMRARDPHPPCIQATDIQATDIQATDTEAGWLGWLAGWLAGGGVVGYPRTGMDGAPTAMVLVLAVVGGGGGRGGRGGAGCAGT